MQLSRSVIPMAWLCAEGPYDSRKILRSTAVAIFVPVNDIVTNPSRRVPRRKIRAVGMTVCFLPFTFLSRLCSRVRGFLNRVSTRSIVRPLCV